MNTQGFATDWLDHLRGVMEGAGLTENLSRSVDLIRGVKQGGGKLLFAGNGASATIASHFALDFTKQGGVRSMAFNDAALITAYGNDFGYGDWVARAVAHHGQEGDAAILISTSGSSENMVNAARQCRGMGIPVVAFTGFARDNPLNQSADVRFWADSRAYNVVESVHGLWLGLLCDLWIGKREYTVAD